MIVPFPLDRTLANDADLPVMTFEASSGAESVSLVDDRSGKLALAAVIATAVAKWRFDDIRRESQDCFLRLTLESIVDICERPSRATVLAN